MKEQTLSGWPINVGNIDQTGKHPHVTDLLRQFHLGFVGMDEVARHDIPDNLVVCPFVVSRCHILQTMDVRERKMNAKAFPQGHFEVSKAKAISDMLMHYPSQEIAPKAWL